MASDSAACIFCGGETRCTAKNIGRQLTERRICLVCGHTFERSTSRSGAICTVNGCPERRTCLLKNDAERCATYRAIVIRGLKVSK